MSKGRFAFPLAMERGAALGEIHARPLALVKSPRVIFQLAFMTDGGSGVDHTVMANVSREAGVTPPGRDARHHAIGWGRERCAGSGTLNSRPGSGIARRRNGSAWRFRSTPSETAFHLRVR